MRLTVLCNEEAVGEVDLDPAKAQQSAPLASFPAFERIRSTLERAADTRTAWAQRIGEAMPEELFANLSEAVGESGVTSHHLSPDRLEADYPELAAVLREQTLALAATRSSLRFSLEGEHQDMRLASARVQLWMPPHDVRSHGVPPQVIVLLNA